MARFDHGGFGGNSSITVTDALDLGPGYRGCGMDSLSMAQLPDNPASVRVKKASAAVKWNRFLYGCSIQRCQQLVLLMPVPNEKAL